MQKKNQICSICKFKEFERLRLSNDPKCYWYLRQYLTDAVNPLGTSRTIGMICDESDMLVKPSDLAMSATLSSCSWKVYECIRATARLDIPKKVKL
jgi:hypothetical protein